jgi:hypothetical protein
MRKVCNLLTGSEQSSVNMSDFTRYRGVDQRHIDPLKLELAAYYYNRAKSWGKEVSFTTKKAAFAPSGTNTKAIAFPVLALHELV